MSKSILISLIGKETIPNYRAFKEFLPDILVQVYSGKTEGAAKILLQMVNNQSEVISLRVIDGNDFQEILNELNSNVVVSADDFLMVNVTGGTKMMALALDEFARSVKDNCKVSHFYIDLDQQIQWYLMNRKESFSEILTLDEFIQLSGQKILSKDCYNDVISIFESSLSVIKTYLNQYANRVLWDKFLREVIAKVRLDGKNYESSKQILNRLLVDGGLGEFEINWNNEGILIEYKNKVFVDMCQNEKDIEWFLFNAGWFELLTAQKLASKFAANEIFMNVEFPSLSNETKKKNEVDILINDGGKLIFVECKSGKVITNDIDRIKVRKETYGGLISQNLLITRYPLENTNSEMAKLVMEKCEELGIEYKTIENI